MLLHLAPDFREEICGLDYRTMSPPKTRLEQNVPGTVVREAPKYTRCDGGYKYKYVYRKTSKGTGLLRLSPGAPSMGYILASKGEPPVPPLYSSSTARIKTSEAMINVRTVPKEKDTQPRHVFLLYHSHSPGTSCVGAGVGAGVGSRVGSGVGPGVGSAVGVGSGTGVGPGVGSAVGAGSGTGVGSGVGSVVGARSGTGVGPGVGSAVGTGIITQVGTGVGSGVSSGVTTMVGSGVSSGVGETGTGVGTGICPEVVSMARSIRQT